MSTRPSSTSHAALHPAPHRDRVGRLAIAFGLGAAPAAWGVQLLFNASLASHACFPKDVPLAAPSWTSVTSVVVAIAILALVICLFATLVAWRSWLRTATERPGSAHHLLESGDGRTRFLAMAGMMSGALFSIAIVLTVLNTAGVPACGG
jgi:hypothetical protein